MKKVISLSLFLLANIILLVHTVIPHHHHANEIICFYDSHCENSQEACANEYQDAQTGHHEHKRNASSEKCCVIDDSYTFTHNNLKTSCHPYKKCDCGKKIFYSLISNVFYSSDFVNDPEIHFRQNPFVPLFYSVFISQSIGLRAPPVC
ncbi:MAG: hypothetical protein LBE79_04185 [Tannerella sp.]|jgi:hypothetical protein|nr:hypothetical protein [Tannerella sp.]